MHTITALTSQQRRTNRVNVFLDGEYAFSLALDVAARLRVGDSLSAEQIAALQAACRLGDAPVSTPLVQERVA